MSQVQGDQNSEKRDHPRKLALTAVYVYLPQPGERLDTLTIGIFVFGMANQISVNKKKRERERISRNTVRPAEGVTQPQQSPLLYSTGQK